MRLIFLSVAVSLCAALVIPEQEVLAEFSEILPSSESSQNEKTAIDSWWSRMAELAQNGHQSATKLALSALGLEISLDTDIESIENEDEDNGDFKGEKHSNIPHRYPHHHHHHPHHGGNQGGRPGYGDEPGWGEGPGYGEPGYGGPIDRPGCGGPGYADGPNDGWPGGDGGPGGGGPGGGNGGGGAPGGGGGWPGGGSPGGGGSGGGNGGGPGGGGGGGWPGGGGPGSGGGNGGGSCPGGSPGGGSPGWGGGGWPGGPGRRRDDPGRGREGPGCGYGPGYGNDHGDRDYDEPGHGEWPDDRGYHGRWGRHGKYGQQGRCEDCHHFYVSPKFCTENHTLWELVNENRETSRLAELLREHDDLVTLLSDSENNYTLLAPTNRALDRFLRHEHQSSDIKEFLQYHILPRQIELDNVKNQQTLPTSLNQSGLGKDLPQRLVVNKFHRRVLLNGASEVIAGDIVGSNGILHEIDTPVVPPPNTSTILKLLPHHFSTFALGLEKTGLAHQLTDDNRVGGTTFAPTNAAFGRLGQRANDYLFSSGGQKCLQALLEYHLVPNRTLYSDVLYDERGDVHEFGSGKQDSSVHIELPTLLEKQDLSVDIAWPGFSLVMRVNGVDRVRVHDVLAQDGVVHILDAVLMPPTEIQGKGSEAEKAILMLRNGIDECKGIPREEL
ncbi:hypothetical protein N7450_008747 [Penicillium hetheringtonii]|uniref:FAS1 domain-containing protein n=1 Tax=Penicillium hetheringtonii TaxID=911720 RepID=A0AAD6DDG3_9EURO|nr:hypothetical protein N7450_008747 [Penicillium hetheringtonii]